MAITATRGATSLSKVAGIDGMLAGAINLKRNEAQEARDKVALMRRSRPWIGARAFYKLLA
jgi:hypothetical protein